MPLKQQAEGLWAIAQRGQELGLRLTIKVAVQGKPMWVGVVVEACTGGLHSHWLEQAICHSSLP